jgi:GR25 family glycosyltransferase involved in LPS biosynthesis
MKIYLINLKRNPERLELFFENLPSCWKKNDITVVEGIDGREADIPEWFYTPNNLVGRYGCYKSHLNIIESITDTSLILEDDVVFDDNFCYLYEELIEHIKNINYDMFYLGGKHWSKPTNTMHGSNIKKCVSTIFTHAYIINGSSAKKISKLLKNQYTWKYYLSLKNYEIDLLYAKLQKQIVKCYCIDPFIIYQNQNFKSDTKNN